MDKGYTHNTPTQIFKKNYVICLNPIYSSKYTLHDKQNKYSTATAKTLENRIATYMRTHFSAY